VEENVQWTMGEEMTDMTGTSSAVQPCRYCGSTLPHPGICPSVKAIEYHPDGTVKRVEFHGPAPIQTVYWPQYPYPNYPQPWPITSYSFAGEMAGAALSVLS